MEILGDTELRAYIPLFRHIEIECFVWSTSPVPSSFVEYLAKNCLKLETLSIKSGKNPFKDLSTPLANLKSFSLQLDGVVQAGVAIGIYFPVLTHLDLSKSENYNDWFTKTPIPKLGNVNIGTVNKDGIISFELRVAITDKNIRAVSGLHIAVTKSLGMNQNMLEHFLNKNPLIEVLEIDVRNYANGRELLEILAKFKNVRYLVIINYMEYAVTKPVLFDHLIKLILHSDSTIVIPGIYRPDIPKDISLNNLHELETSPIYNEWNHPTTWLPHIIDNRNLRILTINQFLNMSTMKQLLAIETPIGLERFTYRCKCAEMTYANRLNPGGSHHNRCDHDVTVDAVAQLCASEMFPDLQVFTIISAWVSIKSIREDLATKLQNIGWSMELKNENKEERAHLTRNKTPVNPEH